MSYSQLPELVIGHYKHSENGIRAAANAEKQWQGGKWQCVCA